jgi:hypothetical protein
MSSGLKDSARHPPVSIGTLTEEQKLAGALHRRALGLRLYPDERRLLNAHGGIQTAENETTVRRRSNSRLNGRARSISQGAMGVTSGFGTVQVQAATLLANLRKEIRGIEAKLLSHQSEESRLRLSGSSRARGRMSTAGGHGRVNWRAVLVQIPRQFRVSDIRKVPGLKHKQPSVILAAVTRWIAAGQAKRKTRGVYERTIRRSARF